MTAVVTSRVRFARSGGAAASPALAGVLWQRAFLIVGAVPAGWRPQGDLRPLVLGGLPPCTYTSRLTI